MKLEFAAMLDHDPWPTAPVETDAEYSRTWQRVSVAVQIALRRWALEIFLRDLSRCEDRAYAFPMIVYASSRVFYGQSKAEFTWDPADPAVIDQAMHGIGMPVQRTLAMTEARLRASGREELACRYSPIWYLDVLVAARHRSRVTIGMLARESKLIESIIGWGTERNERAARRFLRVSNAALRNFHELDMRELTAEVLREVTRALDRSRVERARVAAYAAARAAIGEAGRNAVSK